MKSPDLIGKRFGEWTVIRRAATRLRNVYWVCRCSCGNLGEVPTARLTQGKSLRCATCARKLSGIHRRVSRVGLRLGRLVVTAETDDRLTCMCDCGTVIETNWINLRKNKQSCGCLRRDRPKQPQRLGPNKPSVSNYGYLRVWDIDHYAYAHALVMEWKLGRKLLPGENVHHLDGNKLNNLPENLELWTTQQPSGQRVEDKVHWAREFLRIYGALFPE